MQWRLLNEWASLRLASQAAYFLTSEGLQHDAPVAGTLFRLAVVGHRSVPPYPTARKRLAATPWSARYAHTAAARCCKAAG